MPSHPAVERNSFRSPGEAANHCGMSRWKRFRYHLERLGIEALAWAIPRLSRVACMRLGHALGEIAYRVDRRGRAVALSNLECVFGDRFTPAQRVEVARASYRNFLRTMLDHFWSVNLTAKNWSKWIKLDGFAEMHARLLREKRGAVFLCVHQGNWEWANLASGFLGTPSTVVAENFKNPGLTATFNMLRERTGNRIIAQENSLLRMLKIVKRGGSTGMLLDLNLHPTQAATVIEAFGSPGLKMCVPLLHSVLAQRADALLIPVETRPQSDGSCLIVVNPPIDAPEDASLQEISQRCWDAFEPIVLARPGEWLWPYKHFRYQPRDAGRAYPTYSNCSSKFEKLQRALQKAVRSKP